VDRSKDMGRSLVLVSCLTAVFAGWLAPAPARAQSASPLAGVWTLNRSLSEFPRDVGFNMSWLPASGGDGQGAAPPTSGNRGRQGSGGGASSRTSANPFSAHPESYEDGKRLQLLTAEVRNPPVRLNIVDTPATVTITNELGQSRTLHPDGKDASIEFQGVPMGVTSKRDGDRLVVVYRVEQDREIRYTYAFSANPSRLIVDVQFLEHGAGDKVRRIYDPGVGTEMLPATTRAAAPASPGPGTSGTGTPDAFDQRPGAELRGLKTLGILVEDLGAEAVACGLNHDAVENALSKRLTDGGFVVRKNTDDDTYVYVNIITSSLPNGTCVSRYDAFLYTYATAKLSYHEQPVLVQVSLIHRGGIGSNPSALHPAAVMRGLENYIDVFATQIHDASK
jgi:hypothetical protein